MQRIYNNMNKYILLILTLFGFNQLMAQNGKITGKVVDATDGLEIIGAAVQIKGTTKGTATDFEGKFTIENVEPGTYTVQVSYLSYSNKEISGVVVKPNGVVTLNVSLVSAANDLNEIVVQVEYKRETMNAILIDQKNASSIGDGISADVIKTTPAKTTSDVLKKVSGASIQDNKFAIIRGLNDRYNAAFINGAPLPSSEADRKAFSFDIFPSNLIDNMVITKTATPDMPAEFAGGIIQISTKDIPDKNFYTLSLGSSVHSLTTFQPWMKSQGGKYDFLGLDDGTRAIPSAFPGSDQFSSLPRRQRQAYSSLFKNTFGPIEVASAAPNTNFQFTMGQKTKLFGKDFGSIFALTYNNSYRRTPALRQDFAGDDKVFEFNDEQYSRNVLWGALWNLSYKLNNNNKISFRNMFNVNTEDQVTVREGQDIAASGLDRKAYAIFYNQNLLYTGQLIGEHLFEKAKNLKVKWVLGYSDITRDIPDFRRLRYNRVPSANNENPYIAFLTTNASPNDAGRFYSNLDESVYSGSVDFSLPLDIKGKKSTLKFGYYYQSRVRDFNVRVLGNVINSTTYFNPDLLRLGIGDIFNPTNFMDSTGFSIAESTNKSDSYDASSSLNSGYAMLDMKLTVRLRAVFGVRVEAFSQNVYAESNSNVPTDITRSNVDVLPSLNLAYELSQKSNLRFAASQTLSRPEFRELAPFSFFDFNNFVEIVGNSELQRAKITNLDLRYELFPGNGQLISGSVFFKHFQNPIEQTLNSDIGGGTLSTTYRNATSATNFGLELEYRKSLEFIGAWFNRLTLATNLALIQSEVNLENVAGASNRPLQGQSPFVFNMSLNYKDEKNWSGAISVNRVGKRIAFVGTDIYPDFYENPRWVVDLSVNKSILKDKLEIKMNLADLLAQDLVFYQNKVGNTNTNFEENSDNVMRRFRYGRTVSIGLSYKF